MATDLMAIVENWTPEEKQRAFALLLREIKIQEPSSETKSVFWSQLQTRLQLGRATLSPAEFLRELDRMD